MEDPLHPEAEQAWAAHAALLGEFLDHLPWEGRRVAVGLLLLGVSALPEPDPQALGRWVLQEARRRKSPHARRLLRLAETDPALFRQALDWALWWRGLSEAEKTAYYSRYDPGGMEGRMLRRPPSWKQLGYLRRLGYRGSPPGSMLEASLLIEELKEGEEPLPT